MASITTTLGAQRDSHCDHLLKQIGSSKTELSPVPHAVVDTPFSQELLQQLMKAMPDRKLFAEARGSGRFQSACRQLLGVAAKREDFFLTESTIANASLPSIWCEVANWLGGPTIRNAFIDAYVPAALSVENRAIYKTDLRLVREEGAAYIAPHLDQPSKLCVVVVYLNAHDNADVGTSLLRHEPGTDNFVEIKRVPFKPNTAFVLPRTAEAWHGVAPQKIDQCRLTLHLYIKRAGY